MIKYCHTGSLAPSVRVALAASYTKSIFKFRGSLLTSFIKRGYDVILIAPFQGDDVMLSKLIDLGVSPLPIFIQRKSLNIFTEFSSLVSYIKIINSRDITILIPYTLKPVLYGGIAVLLNKIFRGPRVVFVPMITGLGFLFSPLANTSVRFQFLKKIVISLYRVSLSVSSGVIFQNACDEKLFQELKLIPKKHSTLVVNGSGVSLSEYSYSPIRSTTSFTFVGRLLKSKGILHFLDVASMLAKTHPKAFFNVLGDIDDSYDSIKRSDLEKYRHLKNLKFWGHLDDPVSVIRSSTCVVLPSVYREGVPRSLLEALSIGRLIITTNTPGCNLTCHHKKNGYLLDSCDSTSLSEATLHVLSLTSSQLASMSQYSRRLAERYFDDRLVNSQILSFIDSIQHKF